MPFPRLAALLVVLAGFCSLGCTKRQLLATAAEDLSCPRRDIELRDFARGRPVAAHGCGVTGVYRCYAPSLLTRECQRRFRYSKLQPAEQRARVQDRAAEDFSCSAGDLALTPLASGTYRVEGCGWMREYECMQDGCCPYTPLTQASTSLPHGDGSEVVRTPSQGSGGLPKSVIEAVITEQGVARVRSCYSRVLNDPPFVMGRLAVKFIILPDGHVEAAEVVRSSVGVPDVERCIAGVMEDLRFPPPDDQGVVIVTYPFALRFEGPRASCR